MHADSNERLRVEFNQWAAQGRGASMERHHAAITERALQRMALRPGDRVLDLGCGSGWASRRMAEVVGKQGSVIGVDISDAMIRQARAETPATANIRFECAPAEHLPLPVGAVNRVLSVESFYYYSDQRVVLDELRRVVAPGGRIFFLIAIFAGNERSRHWVAELAVPVHVRSGPEYRRLLSDAGWQDASSEEFLPAPGDDDSHAHALLLSATRAG